MTEGFATPGQRILYRSLHHGFAEKAAIGGQENPVGVVVVLVRPLRRGDKPACADARCENGRHLDTGEDYRLCAFRAPDWKAAQDGSPPGEADVAYFEGVFERHRGGYAGRTPDTVLALTRQDLTELSAALHRPMPAGDRVDLVRASAGITGLVAIIQHDRGDQADAHRWFSTAEKAARESGDRRTLSWVLARRAMVPLNYGAPRQAADFARATRQAAGRAPTGAAALASAVHARALAAIGDIDGAIRAIAATEATLQKIDGDETADTWFGYPGQKHHVHLSQAYTLLGDTKSAYHHQDAALTLTRSPSVMTRALLALDTAACLRRPGCRSRSVKVNVPAARRTPPTVAPPCIAVVLRVATEVLKCLLSHFRNRLCCKGCCRRSRLGRSGPVSGWPGHAAMARLCMWATAWTA